jgi:hypothetical protein
MSAPTFVFNIIDDRILPGGVCMANDSGAITSAKVRSRKPAVTAEDVLAGDIEELAEVAAEELANGQAEKVTKRAGRGDDRVLMKMERGNFSWQTHSGVQFSKEHPFQLVPSDEVVGLIREGGFRRADPEEVVFFYKGE